MKYTLNERFKLYFGLGSMLCFLTGIVYCIYSYNYLHITLNSLDFILLGVFYGIICLAHP